MKCLVVTTKEWNVENYRMLAARETEHVWHLIERREDFTPERLGEIDPDIIFIPHWSWIIPEAIWGTYECVVFHMTDLPYGRGGSPLQNLIVRGHTRTKISALRVGGGIDDGDIYFKRALSLAGSAEAIFRRASKTIFTAMIPYFLKHRPKARPQQGEPTVFKRRTPEESEIRDPKSARELYDMIRMLDAPGYPKAFIKAGPLRLEFSKARLHDNQLTAHVDVHETN